MQAKAEHYEEVSKGLLQTIEKMSNWYSEEHLKVVELRKKLQDNGLYAKAKFKQAGLLVKEPCMWCSPAQLTEEQKQLVLKKYSDNLEFEYFHCGLHAQLFHDLLGKEAPRWCCDTDPNEGGAAAASLPLDQPE